MTLLTATALDVNALAATLTLPDDRGTFTLTGSQRRGMQEGHAGRCLVYVAGLGGCYALAKLFWEAAIHADIVDTVIAIDLRSYGVNASLPTPNGVDDCIEDLQYLANPDVITEAVSLTHWDSFYWAGMSLGALLSLHSIAHHQHRYDGLMLFVPAFKGNTKTYNPLFVMKALCAMMVKNKDSMLTLPYGIDSITQNPQVRAHHLETHGNVPMQQQLGLMISIMKWQATAHGAIKSLTVPVFMATAGDDKICDTASMNTAFKQLPHHDHHFRAHFPTLYHDVLMEPDQQPVLDAITLWTKSLTIS